MLSESSQDGKRLLPFGGWSTRRRNVYVDEHLGQGGAAVGSAGVRTERKGEAMVITIAQPSGANVILAFLVGAATIAAGIVLGIFLPGMIRKQQGRP